jgi:5-formyltetrahydrofolate cyclo-ligase
MHSEKEQLRQEIAERRADESLPPGREDWGKCAEKVRRIPAYRTAQTILASPAAPIHQVRLNILSDRKYLVMPTPGLQKGFILLDPKEIPTGKRSFAVHTDPRNPFARKMPYDKPLRRPIEIIITEAMAVGADGSRLGDGHGHLDLQYAALHTLGWLHKQVRIIAIVEEDRIFPSLPMESTDLGVHWIVTPERILTTPYSEPPNVGVIWDKLNKKQIRRNDALFYLHYHRMD